MKSFKFLLRLFSVFSFLMTFSLSAFADTETGYSTATCPASTSWKTFNIGTSGVMTGSLQNNSNENDYFKIIVAQNGILEINVTANNPNNSNFYLYSGNSCGTTVGSALNTINGAISQAVTAATGTYYIRVNRDGNANYSMSFLLKPNYTASNHRPFTMVYSANEKGNIKIIGNSVLTTSSGCTSLPNNGVNAVNSDEDSNATTFNSTSADLILPAGVTGSDIKYAGLYWQGRLQSGTLSAQQAQARTVKLKLPGGSYQTITSNPAKFNWSTVSGHNDYQGVADITTLIQQSVTQNATASGYSQPIWVADVLARTGTTNLYGAWSIVLVYKDGTATLKNLSAYDGYMGINTSTAEADRTVALSGFLTPNTYPVNASFLIFGGEGDKYYGDSVTLSNPSDGDRALKSTGDIFDSTITDVNGSNVTIRNPNCSNTLGADIHSYNIGKTSSSDTAGIIQTGQTTTTVKLSSLTVNPWPPAGSTGITDSQANSYDTFFPGVFAFATDLYEPDVCYVENIFKGTSNISGIGAQVSPDENLTVRVYIKNKGTEAATGVSVLHQFDSLFPYALNSANYNNSNPAYEIIMPPLYTRTSASDSTGNDLYEYNTTSLLAKINLGTGATSSSGGTFNPNSTSAVFEYTATVKVLDSNYSNVYKAGYINGALGVDYTNNPVTIYSCDGSQNSFYGYSAPVSVTGDFNVVYATNANGALSSGYNYNLPTAIASRADNYKVIALNTGTDILKDMNTTVAVELVDASSGTCSTHTAISDVKTWIPFKNVSTANFSAADIINGVVLADSQAAIKFYKKAGKNVKFRVSYPNDGSGGAVIMKETVPNKYHLANFPLYAGNSCYADFNATTYNPANGNIQGQHTYTQVPEACANAGTAGASAMTQHEVNVCLECIYGTSVNYVCSKDNFAIRPEAFYIKLSDQNQTNGATKQVMSNNISGAVSLNLASGYQYVAEVNATSHVDNNATSGYTTTEGLDSIWTPGATVVTGCNDDTNKSSILNFVNGLVEANLSVDQVGKYSLNITDDTWANVDSNVSTMTHHTSPLFLSGTDCTIDSAVTSTLGTYNGCNISSNHVNSDAGITYVDTSVEYRPYDFNLTSIQMSRGQNFAGTIMGQNTWTYMNHVNVDENMSVRYYGPIRAEGKSGTLLSNFVNNCYSQPINFELNLTFPAAANLQNWRYRLQEVNASNQIWNDTNAAFLSPISSPTFNLLTVPASSFLKAQNGLIDVNLSVNFDRNQTTTINPITVGLNNFQIKCNSTVDCSSRADFSTTHLPDRNVTTDNNTTFVYGRILPRDVRVFGSVPFTANGWYEVFNSPSLIATSLPASKNDATWYTNILHNDVSDGDANVTAVVTATSTTLPISSVSNATGIESYLFNAETPPYGAKAHIATNPWLWYGTNASAYANPGTDCLTHPCFNINVVPAVGATGSAKTGAETKKASKKSTSEAGGTGWKSTSDYAPAIR